MSYVLTLFLVLFLSNSRELTPIHIWVIEFVIFSALSPASSVSKMKNKHQF